MNVADAPAFHHERGGWRTTFKSPEARFEQLGINIRVLGPGQPNGLYHDETVQEAFLVLGGACILILDGEERPLKQWDFVHCPPGTEHIFVGAGDGPCVIFMAGARAHRGETVYVRDEVALRHGAGVETETPVSREAYAPFKRWTPGPPEEMPL